MDKVHRKGKEISKPKEGEIDKKPIDRKLEVSSKIVGNSDDKTGSNSGDNWSDKGGVIDRTIEVAAQNTGQLMEQQQLFFERVEKCIESAIDSEIDSEQEDSSDNEWLSDGAKKAQNDTQTHVKQLIKSLQENLKLGAGEKGIEVMRDLLSWAIEQEEGALLEAILGQEGIEKILEIKDKRGLNVLENAILYGNEEAVDVILGKFPQLMEVSGAHGQRPLEFAINGGQVEIVKKLLVKRPEQLFEKGHKGRIPFEYAKLCLNAKKNKDDREDLINIVRALDDAMQLIYPELSGEKRTSAAERKAEAERVWKAEFKPVIDAYKSEDSEKLRRMLLERIPWFKEMIVNAHGEAVYDKIIKLTENMETIGKKEYHYLVYIAMLAATDFDTKRTKWQFYRDKTGSSKYTANYNELFDNEALGSKEKIDKVYSFVKNQRGLSAWGTDVGIDNFPDLIPFLVKDADADISILNEAYMDYATWVIAFSPEQEILADGTVHSLFSFGKHDFAHANVRYFRDKKEIELLKPLYGFVKNKGDGVSSLAFFELFHEMAGKEGRAMNGSQENRFQDLKSIIFQFSSKNTGAIKVPLFFSEYHRLKGYIPYLEELGVISRGQRIELFLKYSGKERDASREGGLLCNDLREILQRLVVNLCDEYLEQMDKEG